MRDGKGKLKMRGRMVKGTTGKNKRGRGRDVTRREKR